ncbi:MAG TPA: HD domain-containing protein [Polyangiaceae bacterium]|nr:HD domain-containing protein [Polyangiaceae bacterium]
MILRDPVHGLLAFESEEALIVPRLLETPEVQRLRRVRQLGVTSLAFPGAEHTRFAHALGAAGVMLCLLRRFRDADAALPFWQRVSSDRAQDALAAALLHDIGHGPLSHLFESVLPCMPHHEAWTDRLLLDPGTDVHRALAAGDPGRPERVARLIRGEHDLPYLARSVSGTFDVDRCDYLLRDAHATGVHHGHFDLDWLLRSLRFGPPASDDAAPPLAVDGAKGLVAVEEFVLARLFMFQQVYFHKATRAAEWMIRTALALAAREAADGRPPAMLPPALATAARGEAPSLGEYLELDDAVLWQALHAWEASPQPQLSDLCRRVRARALFKTLELFGPQREPEARARALAVARDIALARGLDPHLYVGLDVAEDTPFDEADQPPLVVFSKGPPRRLTDVSFLLRRLAGERIEKVRLLFAPELRDEIVAALTP